MILGRLENVQLSPIARNLLDYIIAFHHQRRFLSRGHHRRRARLALLLFDLFGNGLGNAETSTSLQKILSLVTTASGIKSPVLHLVSSLESELRTNWGRTKATDVATR